MLYNGIRRDQQGRPLSKCTCCGYSGHGKKVTQCGWCEEEPAWNQPYAVVIDTDPSHSCTCHARASAAAECGSIAVHGMRCGTCSAQWCGRCHPTPAGMCPYCNGAWSRPVVSEGRLNDAMSFHRVVESHGDGALSIPSDVSAPYCYWHEWGEGIHIDPDSGWELLTGYSGQHGYDGPIMHASESIGGRMARDILARPGWYVSVVCEDLSDDPDFDDYIVGWAVAFKGVE